jgi:hypothetical protein
MRVVTSLLWFLLASTIAFGFAVGVVAFVGGGTASPTPVETFNPGFGLEMGLYGAFHWALMAIFTLPISVVSLVALMLAVRMRPALAGHRRDSTALILVIAALGMALRAAVLERPTLTKTGLTPSCVRNPLLRWGLRRTGRLPISLPSRISSANCRAADRS